MLPWSAAVEQQQKGNNMITLSSLKGSCRIAEGSPFTGAAPAAPQPQPAASATQQLFTSTMATSQLLQ
jgi:hypothetical protein